MKQISTHRIVCWQFTRRCNRRCDFCVSASGPHWSHSVRDTRRSVTRLADLGTLKISYSGGEPLLHPELRLAVQTGRARGVEQILTSNGDLLARLDLPWLDAFEYIKLSFYGNETIHDRTMGAGHYRALLDLCHRLVARNLVVGVNYMLSGRSVNAIESFLDDAQKANVRQVLLMTYMPIGSSCVDACYGLCSSQAVIESIIHRLRGQGTRFPGGLKVHDYSKYDFFVILDNSDRFTLTRNHGELPWVMGGLFDDQLRLPDSSELPAARALERIWEIRRSSEAIVPII